LEAAAETTTTATSLWAVFARSSNAYGYNAAVNFLVVQASDCSLSFSVVVHFYETKALRAVGVAVHDDLSA
jgi:hypothetical protein